MIIKLLLPVALCIFSNAMIFPVYQLLLIEVVCRQFHPSIPSDQCSDSSDVINSATQWSSYVQIALGLPSLFVVGFYGTLSDR